MQVHEFTLYDMLLRNTVVYGDRPAVIHAQGSLTFRDFLGRVDALAAGLAALPLHKGERVCILALNHPSYLELYGACARLGVLAYPINWRLTADRGQPYRRTGCPAAAPRRCDHSAPGGRLAADESRHPPLVYAWPHRGAGIRSF